MAYQDKISEVNNTLGGIGKCETASNFKTNYDPKPFKNSVHDQNTKLCISGYFSFVFSTLF